MKCKKRMSLLLLVCLMISLQSLGVTHAQEGSNTETFDDELLPGWDRSEGVSVISGVLQIQPENFALLFDGPDKNQYGFEFKKTAPGVIIFRYAIGEGGEYALIINEEAAVLEQAGEGQQPKLLAESPLEIPYDEWQKIEISLSPGSHQVSINGTSLISVADDEPLTGGGLGFWIEGEDLVEIDNLVLGSNSGAQEPISGNGDPSQPALVEGVSDAAVTSPDINTGQLSLTELINELTSTQAKPAQLSTFLVNLGLSVILSYILSRVYIHWGSSLSNRRRFAANFILITVTTTFIILVVRSSVALSLGLVGALSIVRFRSAIKEPEELAYLFFAISIGIGLGDNQRLVTVIALATAILVLGIMRLFRGRQADFNLHLTVANTNSPKVDFNSIVDSLKSHTAQMKLVRFDETNQAQEISFLVEFRDMDQLKEAKTALRNLSDELEITFLDNKGIW